MMSCLSGPENISLALLFMQDQKAHRFQQNTLVSLSSRLFRFVVYKNLTAEVCLLTSHLFLITVCRGGLIDHNISVILCYFPSLFMCKCTRQAAVVSGADKVEGDSSYCKVMKCETSCRQSIVQCENSD